jgi:hypothetical protein
MVTRRIFCASFVLDFGSSERYGRTAACERSARVSGRGGDGEPRLNWTATISGLAPGQKHFYRVRGNGTTLAEGYFTTSPTDEGAFDR